jgi:transcription elongation factor Elf1
LAAIIDYLLYAHSIGILSRIIIQRIMNRIDLEANIKSSIAKDICPNCNNKIGKGKDKLTGNILAVCSICGFTFEVLSNHLKR